MIRVLQTHALPLGYRAIKNDPNEIRTRVTAVKGRCLNRLTMGPYSGLHGAPPNSPSRTRTYDPTVNSRLLYRLSYRGLSFGTSSSHVPSKPHTQNFYRFILPKTFWSSPRPISTGQLHALLRFHLLPIYLVVFKGSYSFRLGYLILRGASRLDAFSVYPFPTWLLCHRPDT